LASPARSWIGGIVLLGLLGYLGYVVWPRLGRGLLRVGGPPRALESPWRTEEDWLLDSIARDLAEMALFAGTGKQPAKNAVEVLVAPATPSAPRSITVAVPGGGKVEHTVELTTFIWSPAEYTELSRRLLAVVGACATPPNETPEPPANLLQALTDPLPRSIERANQTASAALSARMCAPASHEAAALVVSALALREAAWLFYSDTRATLSRITAHLAFAASLRRDEPYGREGRYAMATLLILAGRGVEASAALDRLEAEGDPSPEGTAWRRALRLRLTEDTRTAGAPRSLLERRELYRARLLTLNVSRALDYRRELGREEITDWWRFASSADLSVETGNVLLATALEQELAEIREVAALSRGVPLSDGDLVAALNEPADRCLTAQGPRALGWGTWAAFLERHLLHFLLRRHDFSRKMLGLPDQADADLQEAARRFGKLTHYPLLEVRTSLEARRRPERFDELVELVARRPDIFPAFEWFALAEMAHYEFVRNSMPSFAAWFVPGVPRGTTYDINARLRARLLASRSDTLRSFHAISPISYEVSEHLAKVAFKDQGTLPELEQVFGPRIEYDLRAISLMADLVVRDLEPYGRLLERACELSADKCFDRGFFLVEAGRLAAAAAAYQRGMDEAADGIGAANNSLWLMHYYLDVGQVARAGAVAEKAASTGSYGGLVTQARFLERTGEIAAAESVLQDGLRRYGNAPRNPDEEWEMRDGEQDSDTLLAFYYRMAFEQKVPGYAERFHALADRDFPNGIERLDRASLSGRPSDGISVLKAEPVAERRGMKTGDIIVGLDGVRVRTRRQYFVVAEFTDRPEMALVVFRHPDYVDVKARVPWRRLGMDLRSNGAVNGQRAP
jgi:hypothetical protein